MLANRLQKLANGLCGRCGCRPQLVGKTICEICNTKQLEYRKRNATRANERSRRHYLLHLADIKVQQQVYKHNTRANLKIEVLTAYAGTPLRCQLCPESNIACLTIDHTHGGGTKHRRELFGIAKAGHSSTKFYAWLKTQAFPSGFRVLCMNCNILTYLAGRQLSDTPAAISKRLRKQIVKHDFMQRLGGRCEVCSEQRLQLLTCHHSAGNGATHRRKLTSGIGGYAFYLKCLGADDFVGLSCRCFNHNCGEEWGN